MINDLSLQKLRNSEYIQFLTDTLNIVSKNNPETLNLNEHYQALRTAVDGIEKLFKIKRGSSITKEMEVFDRRRDDAINGIKLLTQGFTYSADAEVKKHAKALTTHLASFGTRITKQTYQNETITLRVITNEWKKRPELMAAVKHLDLGTWLAELERANNCFSQAYIERNEDLATAPNDKLKELRHEANDLYYTLRKHLNANLVVSDGVEPWPSIANLLNQNIGNYKVLLARRGAQTNEQ